MSTISMAGVGGCSYVTMHGKIVADFEYTPGMALALTGDNEVGPGVAGGSAVFGIVNKVEVDCKDEEGNPTVIHLGVQTAGFNERVLVGATAPTFGSIATCNNKGELIKTPTEAPVGSRGIVTAVDGDKKLATIVL